jgi:hypothetical protein
VRVKILLESSVEQGGAIRGDSAVALAEAVPGGIVYLWDPAERKDRAAGLSASVRANWVVADRKLALITSANLTSAALERNMELGPSSKAGASLIAFRLISRHSPRPGSSRGKRSTGATRCNGFPGLNRLDTALLTGLALDARSCFADNLPPFRVLSGRRCMSRRRHAPALFLAIAA